MCPKNFESSSSDAWPNCIDSEMDLILFAFTSSAQSSQNDFADDSRAGSFALTIARMEIDVARSPVIGESNSSTVIPRRAAIC